MTKQRIELILLLCFSTAGLACMTLLQTRGFGSDLERSGAMREAKSRSEAEKRLREHAKELRRRQQERRKEIAERKPEIARLREQRRIDREQRRREFEKEIEEAGGIRLLAAKYALGASKENWRLIRPKLEEVINLWDRANSRVGASLSLGSSDSRTESGGPKLQWERPWQDKHLKELSEAQRLARQLRTLLERKDTTPQAFRRKMADLRKAKSKQVEIEQQLAEARRKLREILTTRQEAVLVLLGWL